MPDYTHPDVADASLNVIRASATHVVYMSAWTDVYANVAGVTLGQQAITTPPAAPTSDADGARYIDIPAPAGGAYTADGSVTHIGFIDATNSRILQVVETASPWEAITGRSIVLDAPTRLIQPRQTG